MIYWLTFVFYYCYKILQVLLFVWMRKSNHIIVDLPRFSPFNNITTVSTVNNQNSKAYNTNNHTHQITCNFVHTSPSNTTHRCQILQSSPYLSTMRYYLNTCPAHSLLASSGSTTLTAWVLCFPEKKGGSDWEWKFLNLISIGVG